MGGKRSPSGPDRQIAALAARQHGVVARRQLEALGIRPDAIDSRLRLGRLHRVHRAVYVVGHQAVPREAEWMAAVLCGGPGAVLSHRPAGALWGFRATSSASIDVTAPGRRRRRDGLVFHESSLPPDEVTVRDRIPVTTVPRTLFDLAAQLDLRRLERAINEAEVLRLWDELSLQDLLLRYPGRPGARNVRAALRNRSAGAGFTRSDLEAFFLSFADRFGFPQPETNVMIEGFEVDCVWRKQRVIVEVDGWATHGTRAAFERDRERSRILQAAGWRCVPVTDRQLRQRPQEVARDLRGMLRAVPRAA